jgi:hypothetical protein
MIVSDKTNNSPKNPSELECWNKLIADGWFVSKKGWPDFACFKDGKFAVVEVKPKRGHRLKRAQYRTMLALVKSGVKCYKWSPDSGFELITESTDHV